MTFEIVEHTADVGLVATAPSLEELFVEAGRGLIAVMGRGAGTASKGREVRLGSPDVEALLVDWLSELIYLFEVHDLAFADAQVTIGRPAGQGDWTLRAEVSGTDAGAFDQGGPAVKAVTYHALEVSEDGSGARARVYLDV